MIASPPHASWTIGDTPAPITSGVVSTCAINPIDGRVDRAGKRREHGVTVVQLGIDEPDLAELLDEQAREIELLLRARTLRDAIRGLRVHAHVAQEPLEDVPRELLRERAREGRSRSQALRAA